LPHLHAYGYEIGISLPFIHVSRNGTGGDGDVEVKDEETFEKPVVPNVRMTLLY
jgi:hypothetical protein